MKIYEHNFFNDVYIPYIVEKIDLSPQQRRRLWAELSNTPLTTFSRWVLARSIRDEKANRKRTFRVTN